MPYLFLAAVLAVLDQIVKVLVRTHIPLGQTVPVIPGVMGLTYVRNTGAAFSSFANSTALLAVLSGVVSVVLVIAVLKRPFPSRFAMVCLTGLLAGAVGNFIDRCFIGYVTDMFQTLFINFAVFNVADICLVLSVIGLCIYILFLDKEKKQ